MWLENSTHWNFGMSYLTNPYRYAVKGLSPTVFTSSDNMVTALGTAYKNAGGSAWNGYARSDAWSFGDGDEMEFTNISVRSVIVGLGKGTSIGNAQYVYGLRVETTGVSGQMDVIKDGSIDASKKFSGGVGVANVWNISQSGSTISLKRDGVEWATLSTSSNSDPQFTAINAYTEFSSPLESEDTS